MPPFSRHRKRMLSAVCCECPDCKGLGYHPPRPVDPRWATYRRNVPVDHNKNGCRTCNGTGKVLAADAMERILTR